MAPEPEKLPGVVVPVLLELERLERKYRQIPVEAIVKQDVLRLGIDFDPAALKDREFKNKDYFIFSFDHIDLDQQSEAVKFQIPEEIKIFGGHFDLKPTVISVRYDPSSPYRVLNRAGAPVLKLGETEIGTVEFPPIPSYYRHRTSSGKYPGEVAPVIEWGYLIYLTVFRNCQYFGKDEECAFCDINHNYRQQKNEGRPYTGIKSLADILEVLSWIDKEDDVAKVYTLTGGSVTGTLKGKDEADFYIEYAEAIEEQFSGRWIGKIVTQAWEQKNLLRLKQSGIKIYHPNFEVWDSDLFSRLCPGKERTIGRDKWLKRILDSAEIFGSENVIPNFVGGVELARPYGFDSIEKAIESTSAGLDFFMSRGIVPRFTTWCPEPGAALGKQDGAPLEYFCALLTSWKQTFEKYSLAVPPGYGPAGPGNALFSVSAFMDVISYRGRL